MKKEKSCGAIIFNNNNILLVKHQKGHWSFPKGHVEKDETEITTALREIKEETNLDVIIDDTIREVTTYSPYKNCLKDVIFFKATAPKDQVEIDNKEIIDYKWLNYEDAIKLITFDTDKKVLSNIYSKILGN